LSRAFLARTYSSYVIVTVITDALSLNTEKRRILDRPPNDQIE
jgi:hypothetical protein